MVNHYNHVDIQAGFDTYGFKNGLPLYESPFLEKKDDNSRASLS